MLLVAPRRGADGDPAFPHPLWEELCAAMPSEADEARLARSQVQLPRAGAFTRPLRAVVSPRRQWTTARQDVALRPVESPSSLEAMLRCSFRWALTYPGRYGAVSRPPFLREISFLARDARHPRSDLR